MRKWPQQMLAMAVFAGLIAFAEGWDKIPSLAVLKPLPQSK